jgi:hypothetical protein
MPAGHDEVGWAEGLGILRKPVPVLRSAVNAEYDVSTEPSVRVILIMSVYPPLGQKCNPYMGNYFLENRITFYTIGQF